jgi:hypothetical protein
MVKTCTGFFAQRSESRNRDLNRSVGKRARKIDEEIARNIVFDAEYVDQDRASVERRFWPQTLRFFPGIAKSGGSFAIGAGVEFGRSSAMVSGVSHAPAAQPKAVTAAHTPRLTIGRVSRSAEKRLSVMSASAGKGRRANHFGR